MDIKQSSEKRFALLIDADNVSAKYIKPITDELSKYGTVTYKRIYGDWTLTLHAKWKDALLENSITPIQQFGYTQGKNATDSAMIIDAMDILYTRSVEGFCIVSSDSDFTRLASRIRESGLTVIGMGEKKTPTPFRKACDIFTTLELLLGDTGGKGSGGRSKSRHGQPGASNGQGAGVTTMSKDEIEQAVVNIITDNQNNGKSTGLGEVGSRLLKRYPDFDVRSYGTNQLKKLLDEFESVVVTKDGSSVTVELAEDKETQRGQAGGRAEKPVEHASAPEAEAAPAEEEPEQGSPEPAAAAEEPGKKPRRSARAGGRGTQRPDARGTASEGSSEAEKAPEPAAAAPEAEAAVPEAATEAPVDNRPGRASRKRAATSHRAAPKRDAAAAPAAKTAEEAEGAPAAEPAARPQQERSKQARRPRRPGKAAPAADAPETPAEQASRSEEEVAAPQPAAEQPSRPPAAKRKPRARKAAASPEQAPKPADGSTPEGYVRALVADAGPDGIALATLGKRVRGRFRTFKLRDLGYSQFRAYVADLDGIALERRDGEVFARPAE